MEDVLRLLRDVMGSSVEILEAETVKQDEDYQVIIAGLRRPSLKVVIKLAGPGAVRISSFERTAAIHQMVANRTSIPMPTVIAANESYQKWPWRYFIKTYLAGEEWAAIRDQLSQE